MARRGGWALCLGCHDGTLSSSSASEGWFVLCGFEMFSMFVGDTSHLSPGGLWVSSETCLPLLQLLKKMTSMLPPPPPCHHLSVFLSSEWRISTSWAGWWWQAELVALVPGAGVSPDEQQYDWRIVESAMGDGSTPNFSLSLFHEAMAVDVWQHAARWDLKPGLS